MNRNNTMSRGRRNEVAKRRRTALLLSVLVTVFSIAFALEKPNYIHRFELAVNDMIYNLGIEEGDTEDVVIIGIDNQSINEYGRWPWHRNHLAELISSVAVRNPKVIGLDILLQRDFEEDTLGHTDRLAAAIKAAGNVVVPFYFTLSNGGQPSGSDEVPEWVYHNSFVLFDNPMTIGSYPIPRGIEVYAPDDKVGEAAAALGHVNIIPDIDGRIRWEPFVISYNAHYFPSFALQVSRMYLGLSSGGIKLNGGKSIQLGNKEIITDSAMRIPIRYSGGYNTFRYISAIDVIEGNVKPGDLKDKVVLVGYVAADNRDIVSTPVTDVLPGVEKQANAIENIINTNILQGVKANAWLNLLIIIAFGAMGTLIFPRIEMHYRLAVILGSIFLLFNIGYLVFSNYGIMLQFFYPALELIMFLAVAPLFTTEREHRPAPAVSHTDSRFAPADSTQPVQSLTGEQTIIANADNLEQMGRYKIEGILGRGAMGSVYKGVDPAIGRPVAIKTIRLDRIESDAEAEEMARRLSAEAHSAGRLSHPNIITIYDVGQERNLQYIAMEFLVGRTLEDILKSDKTPDVEFTAKILVQTADALDYAHRQNVVHRDIKPANIMVLEDGTVKVMDFGIARVDNMHMTQTGITVGTPNYISPEQLQGADVDGRADIFSSGVLLYECLAGKKPFSGENISTLVVNILNIKPPVPSSINKEVPEELDKITMKTLEKNPENRYQSAHEFAEALRGFLGNPDSSSKIKQVEQEKKTEVKE
ncbi:MAG: CHASE2 domain-containing protein [candidate division Zixibacteria bacterium]|nr:CHASE2 domain-containing protein [candidate division Zixibacteria bacterium]